MALSNLQLRLASAAVGLPIIVFLVFIGGWPFAIVAGIIALLAAGEFTHGFLIPSRPLAEVWALVPGFAAAGIMVAGAHATPAFVLVGLGIGAALWLAGLSRTNILGPRKPLRVYAGSIVYIGALFSTLVLLRNEESGRDWVLLALLCTFAVDTGAYAVGKLIGRHKMAPRISPGKTWEGAIGGFAAGFAAVAGLHALFDLPGEWAAILPLAALVPVAAVLGDLLESWIKRRMGIKDASGFIPGHGGFMDRMDSVLFVVPVVYLFAAFVVD
jgi:phosphatidate cytidylyltransferase